MMLPLLNGEQMEPELAERIRYHPPHPEPLAKNGRREPIFDTLAAATLEWAYVTDAEWTWLTETVLGGNESVRCTDGGGTSTLHLWDREMVMSAWGQGVIHYPQGRIEEGEHREVSVRIDRLKRATRLE